MRKAIKIKTLIISLAWIVIFAHSIIPHNHHSEYLKGCHNIIHNVTIFSHCSDKTLHIDKKPSEGKVCHFSGLIYHHLNSDNLVFPAEKEVYILPVITEGSVLIHKSTLFFSDPYLGNSSLRAPPVS